MANGIDTPTLCRLAGIPVNTLDSWLHRGIIPAPPTSPGRAREWDLGSAFGVALFAALLAENRTVGAAARDATTMCQALGQLATAILQGQGTGADRVIFVRAEFASGEIWHRMVTTRLDRETLMAAILKRDPVRVDLRDMTALYARVLEAFARARAPA